MNWLLNLLFPSRCLSCRTSLPKGGALCENCSRKISLHRTLFCGQCRARLPEGKKVCHKASAYIFGAAADYEGPVKDLIHGLKFRFVSSAGEALGKLLVAYARSIPALEDLKNKGAVIIPIPLSPRRLRERGFNQSEILGRALAASFGLPLNTEFIVRPKNSKPQSETRELAERLTNVQDCFAINGNIPANVKVVILVDDVATSGATLLAAAQTLKRAGVRRIIALVAAKA